MSVPVSHLTSHLGYWLRYVSNAVSHAFARKLESRDVTVAEWVLLRDLYGREADAPSRIAGRLGMTRGAITRLADRLIDKALIARRNNPDDARAQTLRLTDAGRALVPELSALADANDAEFFADMPHDDRAQIERILKDLIARRGLTTIPLN